MLMHGELPAMKEAEEQPSAWKAPARQWTLLLQERDEQAFLVLTLLIGALVGAIVVAFILLTERFGARLYPAGGAAWRRLLVPVTGSLGMGFLLFRCFPAARGSGVPQTKAALFAREGRITLGTVVGKFFCTSATLASGIPLGREGPAVQVGAGLASVLGRKLGLRPEKVKALLPVGAAAAIAAAFNTPLAAVLFALEEIVGDLHFFFSSRRRLTRSNRDWSSDVCSSDLYFFRLERRTRISDRRQDAAQVRIRGEKI